MTIIGESGAQSTVIPGIEVPVRLQHSRGGQSEDLEFLKVFMPKPHRDLLSQIDPTAIRSFVKKAGDANLPDVYNLCLERRYIMRPMIVVHGGAWTWDDNLDAAKRAGIKNAVTLARAEMEETEQVMVIGEDTDKITLTLGISWIENKPT